MIAPGDWNCTPDQLRSSGVLEQIGMSIIVPANVSFTCTQGHGSMIDYVLVTTGYEALIRKVEADVTVPWKPHRGLRITFKGKAKGLTTTQVKRPKPLTQAKQDRIRTGEPAGHEVTWQEAKQYAAQLQIGIAGGPDHMPAWQLASDLGIVDEVRQATEEYARWSAAAEYKALVDMGYTRQQTEGSACAAYRGRGRVYTCETVSMAKKCTDAEHVLWLQNGFSMGMEADAYAAYAAAIAGIAERAAAGKTLHADEERWLTKLTEDRDQQKLLQGASEAAHDHSKQNAPIQAAMLRLAIAAEDRPAMEELAAKFRGMETLLIRRHRRNTRERYLQWIRDDLAQGAGGLHRATEDPAPQADIIEDSEGGLHNGPQRRP